MRPWRALATASALASAAIAASCGHSLPKPAEGPAPAPSAFVEVPYPPPPGRVEIVPPRPAAREAVWIDGQWVTFAFERFVWQPGAWVRPPPGSAFTAWRSERRPDGRVYFAPPAWRGADGGEVPAPTPITLARHGEPSSGGTEVDGERLERPGARGDAGAAPSRAAPLLDDAGLEPPRLRPAAGLPGPPKDASASLDAMPAVDAGGRAP